MEETTTLGTLSDDEEKYMLGEEKKRRAKHTEPKKAHKPRERETLKISRHGCNHECSVLSQFSVVSNSKRFGRGSSPLSKEYF